MFICDNCSATFEAKKEYSQHSKKCLKEVETFIWKLTNQSITVKKNAQGNFECYCSDSGCPNERRVYKTIESLKRHLKKVDSHWVGPSKVKSADMSTKHITDMNEQTGQVDSHPARSINASSAHQVSKHISRRVY
jgi:uncharacterized C2H2 Zn-finger protein